MDGLKPQVQEPSEVAKSALKELGKRAVYISGRSNRFNYFILTRDIAKENGCKNCQCYDAKMYPDV